MILTTTHIPYTTYVVFWALGGTVTLEPPSTEGPDVIFLGDAALSELPGQKLRLRAPLQGVQDPRAPLKGVQDPFREISGSLKGT